MALDTQAKIVASDIGSFCNQREWSEFYYRESINYYQKLPVCRKQVQGV